MGVLGGTPSRVKVKGELGSTVMSSVRSLSSLMMYGVDEVVSMGANQAVTELSASSAT